VNNLNSILLEGNLVRDPELSYTPKGTAVTTFTVASNRFYKQDGQLVSDVSFFPVTCWARLAEVCHEFLKKGRGVRIVGRLKQDRWKDADGQNRSRVHIVAEHVEFRPISAAKQAQEAAPAEEPAAPAEELDELPAEAVEA
jgi:single-strand DNA-binding protein